MKRCPECQFLYDNESTQCDMDGTPLRYTVKLPTLPGLAQSIWDRWTIALLIAVVMMTVLAILYRATPRAYTSPAGHLKSIRNETPGVNQSLSSADSEAPPESMATQSAIDEAERSTDSLDPSEAQSTTYGTRQKSKQGVQTADEKEAPAAPAIHVQAADNQQVVSASSTTAKPTAQPTTDETFAGGTSAQKPASFATSTSIHPAPPPALNKATPANQKKDSGFKSMLKKAGKVLKKPFGEN